MSSEVTAQISIQNGTSSTQPLFMLKIQVDPDTLISELLEYLIEQEKITIPIEDVEVISKANLKVSKNSKINDFVKNGNAQLQIRAKAKNNISETPVKYPNVSKSLQSSEFNIPKTGEIFQQQPKYNPPAPKKVQEIRSVPVENRVILKIQLVDGDNIVSFDFPASGIDCLQDLRDKINKHIIDHNFADNWTLQEEVRVSHNNNPFKKEKYAFQKINLPDSQGVIRFRFDRMYPGGGMIEY